MNFSELKFVDFWQIFDFIFPFFRMNHSKPNPIRPKIFFFEIALLINSGKIMKRGFKWIFMVFFTICWVFCLCAIGSRGQVLTWLEAFLTFEHFFASIRHHSLRLNYYRILNIRQWHPYKEKFRKSKTDIRENAFFIENMGSTNYDVISIVYR